MLRIENARGGGQRIDGGIDAQRGDVAREVGGGVEVREGGGRRGIGVIVGGHVDGLHGRDRALVGGGDALLQFAHFGGQVGLVSHGARHAAEQRRNFRTGLREAENVVDEEQHVLAFLIAEVLGHGQAGQADAQTGSGRLGHLAVDQGALGFGVIVGSMTPDSWNSSQRSLPSRVRSPTPANTETPPCFMARLLMSS